MAYHFLHLLLALKFVLLNLFSDLFRKLSTSHAGELHSLKSSSDAADAKNSFGSQQRVSGWVFCLAP